MNQKNNLMYNYVVDEWNGWDIDEKEQEMLRENGAEHADRESGSEKQVNDEEISDKTQK